MPTITSSLLIHQSPMIGGKPSSVAETQASQTSQPKARAHSLEQADAYVMSTVQTLENGVIGAFSSYQDSKSALARLQEGPGSAANYVSIGGAVKRSALQRTITSGVRNGWELYQGRISASEAGGRIVGDVTTSVVSGGIGALATNAAVWGLSKTSAAPLTVLAVGTVAGWGANMGSNYLLRRHGFTQVISNNTTNLLRPLEAPSRN